MVDRNNLPSSDSSHLLFGHVLGGDAINDGRRLGCLPFPLALALPLLPLALLLGRLQAERGAWSVRSNYTRLSLPS